MNINKSKFIIRDQCGLSGDKPVVIGVSGGPDSLCLLDVLVKAQYPVIVAHYNHQLRPESGHEAEKVRLVAFKYQLPFHLGEADVAGFARENKLSIEEAARLCRYHFLFDLARTEKAEAVAVAHSADDQVETVLMHLLRGAGLSGLKGMAYRLILPQWDPAIPLVRPLLDIWRDDILAYCQVNQLQPSMDQTNLDVAYFRNRLRHELIPYLQDYNPQIKLAIWRMAQSLENDYEELKDSTQKIWDELIVSMSDDAVSFKYSKLNAQSVGFQRNLIRKAIQMIRPYLRDIDFAAIERALEFIRTPSGSGQMELIDGIWLIKSGDQLVIGSRDTDIFYANWPQMDFDTPLTCMWEDEVDLGKRWRLKTEILSHGSALDGLGQNPNQAWLDLDQLETPLIIRTRQDGDRFNPLGMGEHQVKLSDFFINQHVPAMARKRYPLVEAGGKIVWIPGIRPGESARISETTKNILHITLIKI